MIYMLGGRNPDAWTLIRFTRSSIKREVIQVGRRSAKTLDCKILASEPAISNKSGFAG